MKIKILGSGGGEGYPALFCGCHHCVAARAAGGKSIRTLSQTLINNDLLIDFPVDTPQHARASGLNFGNIENVLITHTHSDHFTVEHLWMRGAPFAHKIKSPILNFYGSSDIINVYNAVTPAYGKEGDLVRDSVILNEVSAGVPIRIGSYAVTPIAAKHAPTLTALNYIITDGEVTVLYLLDTGYPTDQTLEFISRAVHHADAVIMDATMGVGENKYEYHMSFADNIRLKEELISRCTADSSTLFVATHITHNNAETHDKIEQIFKGTGITVAYDGIEFEI